MNKTILRTAVAVALILPAISAHSSVININNGPSIGWSISPFGVPNTQTYGEVFTAPQTGKLTSFTLWLNGGVGQLAGGVGTWNGGSTFNVGHGSPSNLYLSSPVASSGAAGYTFNPNVNVTAGNQYVAYLTVFGVAGANNSTNMPISGGTVTIPQSSGSSSYIDYFVWNNTTDPKNNPSWNYFFNAGNARFDATVSPVPVPAAVWLFGSAVAGLLASKRKKTA